MKHYPLITIICALIILFGTYLLLSNLKPVTATKTTKETQIDSFKESIIPYPDSVKTY